MFKAFCESSDHPLGSHARSASAAHHSLFARSDFSRGPVCAFWPLHTFPGGYSGDAPSSPGIPSTPGGPGGGCGFLAAWATPSASAFARGWPRSRAGAAWWAQPDPGPRLPGSPVLLTAGSADAHLVQLVGLTSYSAFPAQCSASVSLQCTFPRQLYDPHLCSSSAGTERPSDGPHDCHVSH